MGITKEVNNFNELSLSLVEEFKDDKAKRRENQTFVMTVNLTQLTENTHI